MESRWTGGSSLPFDPSVRFPRKKSLLPKRKGRVTFFWRDSLDLLVDCGASVFVLDKDREREK